MSEENEEAFLRRWSRLKHEDKRPKAEPEAEKPAPVLPPVEKLTPESDFTPFMNPKVGDAVRRVALKKLFRDPHFQIPDPFEPFSGDWTGGEAISPEMLATLNQAKQLIFSEEKKTEEKNAEEQKAEDKAQAPHKPESDEPGRQNA